MKTLYLGIDVASQSFMAHLKTDEGLSLGKSRSFVNTPQGTMDLETWLLTTLRAGGYERLIAGLEATAFYDWHLADALASSAALIAQAQVRVYRLNALRVSKFHKGTGEVDKTDNVDAAVIADFLRMGRNLPAPHVAGDPYVPLKRLTRYHFHAVETLHREVGHFLTHLFLQHSGLAQQSPLKPTSVTALALIEDFLTPEEIVQKPLEELVAFLVEHGKNRFPDPEAIARKIHQAARESYRLRPDLARSEHFILGSLARNIRGLKDSLKDINQAIADQMQAFPNTLTSLPGVGPVFSAGILSEIGDIRRFPDDDAIAKMAGLVWPRHQSANFDAQDRRLLRSANAYLRYYLVEAANALRMHDATYRAFYESKYSEVPKHKHKRALVLTARKLVRLVFALLSKGQLYRPAAVQPAGR